MTDEIIQEAVVIPGPDTPIVFSVTDAAIAQMNDEFMGLTLPDQDDREGYRHIVDARKMVKKTRLEVGKKSDEMTVTAKAYIKRVNTEADRIVGQLKPIEKHLEGLEDAFEAEKERIKLQKELEQKKRQEMRSQRLRSAGMVFKSESDIFLFQDSFSITWEDLCLLPDNEFELLALEVEGLHKAYLEAEKEKKRLADEETARVAAEKKAEEEKKAAALKAENERLELIRKQQAEQKRKLAEQAAELAKQQEELRMERERMAAESKPKVEVLMEIPVPVKEVPVVSTEKPSPVSRLSAQNIQKRKLAEDAEKLLHMAKWFEETEVKSEQVIFTTDEGSLICVTFLESVHCAIKELRKDAAEL